MAHFASEAADRLAEEGLSIGVLDLRSLRPLDWPSIEAAVQATGKVLIVHEDTGFAGFGAEIAAQIAEKSLDWLDAPVMRYTSPEVPLYPYAENLEAMVMPSVDGIVEHARSLAAY
jgi:pyruvate/2-oxoglutarate/acetoin dehydrogenase E1 component